MTLTYRQIGGLHWLFIGRLRIAVCITNPSRPLARTIRLDPYPELEASVAKAARESVAQSYPSSRSGAHLSL